MRRHKDPVHRILPPFFGSVYTMVAPDTDLVFLTLWIPHEIFRRESLHRFHHHTGAEDLCGAAFMTAIVGLLLISPFYLHSKSFMNLPPQTGWF